MKILITIDEILNEYIPCLIKAYRENGNEVVTGSFNFYQSNYQPDVLHIHWPELLYRRHRLVFDRPEQVITERIRWYKSQGAKIVFTFHDIRPHEVNKEEQELQIYNSIITLSDIIVHHGQSSVKLAVAEYPVVGSKANIVCHHGDYLIQYRDISKQEARKHLNLPLNKFILLNFGNIRPYKGFDLLKKIFRRWRRKDKFLLVAGQYSIPPGDLLRRFYQKWSYNVSRHANNHRFYFQKIRNVDIGYYFSAADAVIITHTSGLTSGILAMAATFRKPAIYPEIGNFQEQMQDWVAESYAVGNVNAALESLNRIADRCDRGVVLDNSVWLARNNWTEHVERILSTVRKLK